MKAFVKSAAAALDQRLATLSHEARIELLDLLAAEIEERLEKLMDDDDDDNESDLSST